MRKFNPVQYMRDKYGDKNHTKNQPKQCDQGHSYCHIQYQWADSNKMHTSSIAEFQSRKAQTVLTLPQPVQNLSQIPYQMITQQNLDDWFAQSINKSIPSLINPQKKFHIPLQYEQQLKARYKNKIPLKSLQDQPYFKNQKLQLKKRGLSQLSKDSKKQSDVTDAVFDYHKLQPKLLMGTPIKFKQSQRLSQYQKQQKIGSHIKKDDIKRRNAVLLSNDIHYIRLLKQFNKQKQEQQSKQFKQMHKNNIQKVQMLYSFNIQSMKRNNCQENVPNSIIQRQYQRIRHAEKDFVIAGRNTMKRQEQIQEKARQSINQKATAAMNKINQLAKKQKTDRIQTHTVNKLVQKVVNMKGTQKNINNNLIKTKQNIGTDKKIQQNVIKLLNKMQVISQHIDVEMSKLDLHLQQIPLMHPSTKIQNKWALKAQQKLKQKQHILAIDCYKQSLILQPQFFIPAFNIAVLLQKQKMLSFAKQWFQLAKQFDTDPEKVSFGLALVQVKQLNYQSALKQISQLITSLQKQKKRIKIQYYYIRALCNKKLGILDKARLDYQIVIKNSKPKNYHSLSYFLLSVVFAASRRCEKKFNCLSYMRWRQTLYMLFFEKQPKRVKQQGMSSQQLAIKLSKMPFFNRFSINLLKKMINQATYQIIKKDSIIFVAQNQSILLINGLVQIWSNQNWKQINWSQKIQNQKKDNVQPETVSVITQGGVLGAGQLDNNLSSKPNFWMMAKIDLQVLKLNRDRFMQFWQGQIKFQWDYKYNFLKNISLFKGLPEATLFKMCELAQQKTFQKNHILFNDCSYRNKLISQQGLGFCLAKSSNSDARFVNNKKFSKNDEKISKKSQKSKLFLLLKKLTFKFNQMKFNRLKYPGLFIMIDGKVQIQDDRGFRVKDIISSRDYFGQNLVIPSDGFHNYGRMVVESSTAKFYLLKVQKLMWAFTSIDKQKMIQNVKNRKQIETIKFLRNRFNDCLEVKMNKLLSKKD